MGRFILRGEEVVGSRELNVRDGPIKFRVHRLKRRIIAEAYTSLDIKMTVVSGELGHPGNERSSNYGPSWK